MCKDEELAGIGCTGDRRPWEEEGKTREKMKKERLEGKKEK